MILVAYTHGLRASEVLELTPAQLDGEFLLVERLKGSERTTQPIFDNPEPLLSERQALIDLVRRTPGNQKLFPVSRKTFWRRMQRYGRAAGLPAHKLHPHALKHSCARQLIDSAGIHRTQAWLGHKSMASTGKYLKASDEEVAAAARRALGGVDSD